MREFNYSFLENGLLPADLVNITCNIYSIRKEISVRKLENIKIFNELEKISRLNSVKSSNAIEDIIINDKRISEIVNLNSKPLTHNEFEISGYKDALNIIHNYYNNISFNSKNVLALHKTMMKGSDDDSAGVYKQNDNVITEVDSKGYRRVIFKPTPASQTKQAMEQLELAYLEASSNSNINQLLLIPCVVLDFLCIHPFRDGNGRISRLLSLLMLNKCEFYVGKYISIEEQIYNHRDLYYKALQQSSHNWETNNNDYFPFMHNFLNTLYISYKELNKKFVVEYGKKTTKTTRIETTVLSSLTPISKAEICSIHPDISPSTVEVVLGKMMKSKKIKRIGASRGSKYIRNE